MTIIVAPVKKDLTTPNETEPDMLALVFDTETTGLVNHQKPVLDPSQPDLVQLGAILGDPDSGKIYGRIDAIVMPKLDSREWTIPAKVSAIHGIYQEDALKLGVYMPPLLEVFLDMVEVADVVVAHNAPFDVRVIEVACERVRKFTEPKDRLVFADPFCEASIFCTLKQSKIDTSIPNTSSRGTNLSALHKHFCGYQFEDAHSAYADTEALWRVFCKMNAQMRGAAA